MLRLPSVMLPDDSFILQFTSSKLLLLVFSERLIRCDIAPTTTSSRLRISHELETVAAIPPTTHPRSHAYASANFPSHARHRLDEKQPSIQSPPSLDSVDYLFYLSRSYSSIDWHYHQCYLHHHDQWRRVHRWRFLDHDVHGLYVLLGSPLALHGYARQGRLMEFERFQHHRDRRA